MQDRIDETYLALLLYFRRWLQISDRPWRKRSDVLLKLLKQIITCGTKNIFKTDTTEEVSAPRNASVQPIKP